MLPNIKNKYNKNTKKHGPTVTGNAYLWHRLPVAGTRKVAGTSQVAQVSIGGTGLNPVGKQMGRHHMAAGHLYATVQKYEIVLRDITRG